MSSVPSKNAPREISCFHINVSNGSCITFVDFSASLLIGILGVTAVFTSLVGVDQNLGLFDYVESFGATERP